LRRMLQLLSITSSVTLCLTSCRDTRRSTGFEFTPGDSELERATDRARQTAPELLQRLRNPPDLETEIGVQVGLAQGDNWETVWLNRVQLQGGNIVGRIDADPLLLTNWKRGDTIRVPPTEIAGWYAIDGDTLYADYRWRVFRSRAKPKKRFAMDSALGLAFPPTIDSMAPVAGQRRWPPRSHTPPPDR
jgi:uncharacterized protein YegJ (DUF2314 family)